MNRVDEHSSGLAVNPATFRRTLKDRKRSTFQLHAAALLRTFGLLGHKLYTISKACISKHRRFRSSSTSPDSEMSAESARTSTPCAGPERAAVEAEHAGEGQA